MLGLEYMYMDTLAPQWQLSKYLINMTQGALGQTLKQLYDTYESEASDISLSFCSYAHLILHANEIELAKTSM